MFPLLKLQAGNGEWEALDFIPPCCAISAHSELTNLTNQCRQWLDKILALVENKEYIEAYYQIGYLQIELANFIRYATPSMLISLLKKAVFILKTNQLLDKEDISRAGEFVWLEYNPNTLSETIQEALSFLHSAVTFLQHAKPEPAPVVEKPKQEPEEEEIAYLL